MHAWCWCITRLAPGAGARGAGFLISRVQYTQQDRCMAVCCRCSLMWFTAVLQWFQASRSTGGPCVLCVLHVGHEMDMRWINHCRFLCQKLMQEATVSKCNIWFSWLYISCGYVYTLLACQELERNSLTPNKYRLWSVPSHLIHGSRVHSTWIIFAVLAQLLVVISRPTWFPVSGIIFDATKCPVTTFVAVPNVRWSPTNTQVPNSFYLLFMPWLSDWRFFHWNPLLWQQTKLQSCVRSQVRKLDIYH